MAATIPVPLVRPPSFVPGGKSSRDALRHTTFTVRGPSITINDTTPQPLFTVPANTFIDEIICVKEVVLNGTAATDNAECYATVGTSTDAALFISGVTAAWDALNTVSSKVVATAAAVGGAGYLCTDDNEIIATITKGDNATGGGDAGVTEGTMRFYCKYRSFSGEL